MIYLDYNATSPVHPEVRKAVLSVLEEDFGNPSSLHAAGRKVRDLVEKARHRILEALGDGRGQLLFTSGGTEADNLAIQGAARLLRPRGDHIVVSAVEHQAVLHPAQSLHAEGFRVTVVPVDWWGRVDLNALEKSLDSRTVLISVMHANNEIGTIQPVAEIARIARERGILFHCDAVQSFGKVPLSVSGTGPDLVSISGHKLGGPKGVGALYIREGVKIEPLLRGGPHEKKLRAGTEGVPGIVGMAAAVEATWRQQREGIQEWIRDLRNMLEEGLKGTIAGVQVNGHPKERLPGTLNISFADCKGEALLMAFDLEGICVSTGAACSSGSTEPSHVLTALGFPPERIEGSIRFSLGWGTTEQEIWHCLKVIPEIVRRVRGS
ncbi:MAG: cysteine desulfurase [Candidatus Omnitrophica bacterium]|nr:cysteine desulfurase [Candidatus Omnitrophota bacterium]